MPILAASLLCHATAGMVAVLIGGAMQGWWPSVPGEVTAGLLLASCLVGSGLMLARRPAEEAAQHAAPAATAAAVPGAQRRGAAPLVRLERRAHPRFPVDWAAAVQWRGTEPTAGRLHDISRGGAFLTGAEPKPTGTEGLLRIDGITVAVPCRIVGTGKDGGIHIAFTIEGLGLDALLAQLDAKLETMAESRGRPGTHARDARSI